MIPTARVRHGSPPVPPASARSPRCRASRSPSLGVAVAGVLGVALVLAPGLLVPSLAPLVRAATPAVTLVAATTYDVLPEEHRVAVTVEITARNMLHDTVTRQYYVDRAYLAVPPGTTGYKVKAATGKPKVAVSVRRASGTVLLLAFGTRLAAGKSRSLTLTFDLPDPGGAPDRALRITPSLVSFQAWAVGTTGVAGSTVRVRFPTGYGVVVGRGPLVGPANDPDGKLVFTSAAIAKPQTFVADLLADRPAALVDSRQPAPLQGRPVTLLIRSWPDDPAWRARVGDLLVRGLPAFEAAIGTPLTTDLLTARETIAGAAIGGTTGLDPGGTGFDPTTATLDVPYTADPTSILHGTAHAWFNGRLVADRWIAEGFASLYAERVGAAIEVDVLSPKLSVATAPHATALNAWVPGGEGDAFGYGASLELARAIADRAGDEAMREVWAAAARGESAYQPALKTPELGAPPPDWRAFLDLLEDRTGRSFEVFWREWVVRPADAALLDARTIARNRYADLVAAAGPWTLPRSIRDAMRAWRFDEATGLMGTATSVLDERELLARQAALNGMTPPDTLRLAFEGDGGLPRAAAEATTELAVVNAVAIIAAGRPIDPDIVMRVGLIGTDPDGDLAAARTAFAAGDLDGTLNGADSARTAWGAAAEVGRRRIISGVLVAATLLLVAWLLVGRWRRSARRRSGWR